MPTNKIQTGLRLNEISYEKLKIIALKEQRSMNNLIEYIINLYLTKYEIENGSINIEDSNLKI